FHRSEALFLLWRVLGDLLVRVGQHLVVILPDRADVGAAPAAGDHARAAQDALPQVEAVFRAQQLLARGGIGFAGELHQEVGQLRDAVRRAVAVAGFPVAVPLLHRIGRANLEAATAGRALAERFLHRPVALDFDRAQ